MEQLIKVIRHVLAEILTEFCHMAASHLQELDEDGGKHGGSMLGVDLQGICVRLSLTAGGNGANNIRNDPRVSKEQAKWVFCFLWGLCFSFLDGVNGR